jgi:hypothetical protein
MERNDLPSSRVEYDGRTGAAVVDFSRDVLSLGPFEEDIHLENPGPGPGRLRSVRPGEPLALPAVFTGFGRDASDEPWQFHRYLTEHRLLPYEHSVTFNSNGVDQNRISTGAKDDMDYATVTEIAPIAKRMGVETFILDDGWQARSGDWQPDSPDFPEPRWDGSADSKFRPRFPDSEFRAVREAIAPMKLGLWMSPLAFHPASRAYQSHPDWACTPVGDATAALSVVEPDDGSQEAGIGLWGANYLPYLKSRIEDAIDNWGVRFFKFDFIVWTDCPGQNDLWTLHDRFVDMLDALRAEHPDVVFQIDETNDYRMFPFESIARGPTWFQNGTPAPDELLHNLWKLSPYVPAFAIGQHFLGGDQWKQHPVSTLMAVALTSHMTFFSDLRALPDAVIDEAAPWISFYEAHSSDFTQLVYPLLDDPLKNDWTALQSWNPDEGRGALLAFRQQSPSPTRTIALENVPDGRTFNLYGAPDGAYVGTVSSADLQHGLTIDLPQPDTARVLLIEPAG